MYFKNYRNNMLMFSLDWQKHLLNLVRSAECRLSLTQNVFTGGGVGKLQYLPKLGIQTFVSLCHSTHLKNYCLTAAFN